jgi:hypothetical protein
MQAKHGKRLSAHIVADITSSLTDARRRASCLLAALALLSTSLLLLPAGATAEPAAPVVVETLSAADRVRIEAESMAVLDAFMRSFNARDPVAHAATYHFPHFRLARGSMNLWPTEADAVSAHKQVFMQLPKTGWVRSQWLSRDIIAVSEQKVHVNTHFQRLRADGSSIGTYNSLYILIKQDGRWGIKMRSSFL